jgi:beta-lactamase class A
MLQKLILQAVDFRKMNCAFIIKNLHTDETVFYHPEEKIPSASLIKLPIMAEVIRQVKTEKFRLQDRISVRAEEKVAFSILTMLETGNDYSLQDLLTLMIVQSDNTAANILINMAGMDKINDFCIDYRMHHTILERKMMDSYARKAGRENFTSAADMAGFLEQLYLGEIVDQASSTYMLEIMKKQLENSMMRLYIPDETVIAHKTGELDGIAHEAGIVYHNKGDYIFVVLIWNALTNNDARQTIGKISKIVYDYFSEN